MNNENIIISNFTKLITWQESHKLTLGIIDRFNSFYSHQIQVTHSIHYSLFTILFSLYSLFCILYSIPSARAEDSPVSATVPSISTSGDTTPPTSPLLIRPTDGTVTGDSTPEFVWRQSTDPNSNTIQYTLYLDNVATYLGVSSDGSSSGAGHTATIDGTQVRLTPTTALSDGTYFWKVVAYDQAGNQASSTSWSLTIDTLAPFLTLTKLDDYKYPTITEESSFEIIGPKAVDFTILTEPYASIRLTLTPLPPYSIHHTPYTIQSTTNHTGEARFAPHLAPGLYSVSISATDHVNLVSVLPTFTINITASQISLLAIISGITAIPLPLLLSLLFILLAFLILILFLHHRRNLILIDTKGNPIHNALITHSLPRSHSIHYSLFSIRYSGSPVYIPHLSRFSTLTIRTQDSVSCNITIFSLSVKRRSYTIVLG